MIVLLLSVQEAQELLDSEREIPINRGLRDYIGEALKMERLLPDDNLPETVQLRRLELDADRRNYVAIVRTWASEAQADQAWELERESI